MKKALRSTEAYSGESRVTAETLGLASHVRCRKSTTYLPHSRLPKIFLVRGDPPPKPPTRTPLATPTYRNVLSQMLELGRQLETELHAGALVASSPTASATAVGVAGAAGGKGCRSRTPGAATMEPGGRGEGMGAGAGAAGEAGDGGKHHSGLLSETDDSRSRSRGAKVGRCTRMVLSRVCACRGEFRFRSCLLVAEPVDSLLLVGRMVWTVFRPLSDVLINDHFWRISGS